MSVTVTPVILTCVILTSVTWQESGGKTSKANQMIYCNSRVVCVTQTRLEESKQSRIRWSDDFKKRQIDGLIGDLYPVDVI